MKLIRTVMLSAAMLAAGAMCAGADEPAGGPARLSLPAASIVRTIAIQHGGRFKPWDSFARETVREITGAARWRGQDPVDTAAGILSQPELWQDVRLISVPFVPLREALGMDRKASYLSYNEIIATRALMRMLPAIIAKQQQDEKLSMLEQETMDLFGRFVAFSNVLEHRLDMVPPHGAPAGQAWTSIMQPEGYSPEEGARIGQAWSGLVAALRDGAPGQAEAAASELRATLRAANPAAYPTEWRLRLEVAYNRIQPFHLARLLYALAALCFLLQLVQVKPSRGKAGAFGRWALPLLWAGGGVHLAGILLRVVLGGRPPVSNFFETMLWLPFVAVVIAVVFERMYRAGFFGLSAAILAAITLVLADLVPLDSSISPVVAVLRSNLWLTIHVLTIVASYGALALATVLAHCYGVAAVSSRATRQTRQSLETFLYRTLQVGVVLLAGGIMLGAVWANASWGRYWGWDPKETWALITLLWFLAVFHGRFAGWIRGTAFALATIGGFFLLLMTYYGVSFYLVGLHSYAGGHAKPLPPLLIGFLVFEAAFMAWVAIASARRNSLR
ncbi:MAG: cytochrome c biogenesis protein CcsA [Candidatus Omnitrophica bacterium]|nr:cytochrome c biogenesis protein CcsA [Candidatus Omnitrophota bacterium]